MGGLLMDEMRALASSSIADLHNCIVSTYAAHPTSTLKEASLQEQQSATSLQSLALLLYGPLLNRCALLRWHAICVFS